MKLIPNSEVIGNMAPYYDAMYHTMEWKGQCKGDLCLLWLSFMHVSSAIDCQTEKLGRHGGWVNTHLKVHSRTKVIVACH